MRWEGNEWTECSTGGGEGIKQYEDGGPPTLCQPAIQQGGGEEVNSLAGGAWRGLEECWGFGLTFCDFCFHTRSLFSFTWELGSGWACLDQFLADRVEREETSWMKVKVS